MELLDNIFDKLYYFFEKHSKRLIIFNSLILVLSSVFLLYEKLSYGYIFEKHVSLSGGTIIKFYGDEYLFYSIRELLGNNANVLYNNGLIYIELQSTNISYFIDLLYSYGVKESDISIEVYNPYFSNLIFSEFTKYISIAVVLIAIALYLRIRRKESAIVILSTLFFDVVLTAAILSLINFKITALSFVGLLMILGYAIDNNIVMATNMFKESDTIKNRIKLSLKIGLFMEITTLIVLGLMLIFIESYLIKSLTLVLFVGLLIDMYYYIFGNIPLYIYLINRKEFKKD